MLSGCYRIPAIHCQVIGVYTNTGMVDAYRGAGRPEATYASSGRSTSSRASSALDPVEVRRRNFIPPDAFPYDPGILAGSRYDSGEYEKALDRALEIVDYEGFRAEQEAARARGPLPRHRLLDLRRDLRRRAVGLDRRDRPGLGRRPVGERERARPPHREGRRHDRLASRAGRGTRRRSRRSSPTSSASRSTT